MSTQVGTYFLGTYGFPIVIGTGADLTGASAVNITLTKPNGSSITPGGTGTVTDAANGKVTFTPIEADVDLAGVYTFSVKVTLPGTRQAVADGSFSITPGLESTGILILETGAGLSNSNSFASVAEGDIYHAGGLYSSAWGDSILLKKQQALIMATRVINYDVEWDGYRLLTTQALEWPRRGVRNRSVEDQGVGLFGSILAAGMPFDSVIYLPTNAIPKGVKDATCELAKDLMIKDRTSEATQKGVTRFSLGQGAISADFDKSDRPLALSDQVLMMLEPFGQSRENRTVVRLENA